MIDLIESYANSKGGMLDLITRLLAWDNFERDEPNGFYGMTRLLEEILDKVLKMASSMEEEFGDYLPYKSLVSTAKQLKERSEGDGFMSDFDDGISHIDPSEFAAAFNALSKLKDKENIRAMNLQMKALKNALS